VEQCFDRSLIDAAAGPQQLTDEQACAVAGQYQRYHRCVFMAPPWPEIYVSDSERRHGFDAAADEYRRLLDIYTSLGYETLILPKLSVVERADFIVRRLAADP